MKQNKTKQNNIINACNHAVEANKKFSEVWVKANGTLSIYRRVES